MPDQIQNPDINSSGQGLPPVIPPAPNPVSVNPVPATQGLSQDSAPTNPGPAAVVEPVPLPKATDVEAPMPPPAVIPDGSEGKEGLEGQGEQKAAEQNLLFEKPETVAPGARSEQRTVNREQRKLSKGVVAGIAALVFLVVGGLGTGLYLLGQRQETRVGACYGSWDCGGNSYCAGAGDGDPGSCAEGGNRDRTLEEIVHDYQTGGGETNDGRTGVGAGQISDEKLEKLSEVYPTAVPNLQPEQAGGGAQPTDSPSGSSCNDCGGFNQGQCAGTGFSGCGSSCDPGLSQIGGGCYPPSYHDCSGKGVYPPETKCDKDDPCASVNCEVPGTYCNGGACVAQKTTTTSDKAIVSFSCSSCSADGRCDSNPQQNADGYKNDCGQVDECAVEGGQVNYSKCSAIKLCDSSCSGGYAVALGGGGNGGGGEAPTATGTPETVSADCQSLVGQVSNGAGGWLTKTDADFVAAARPGDRVRFMCTGRKTQGRFTKSAFYINNVLHIDDVVQAGEDQFAVEYVIPAAGALKVESVLLHDSKGWVD